MMMTSINGIIKRFGLEEVSSAADEDSSPPLVGMSPADAFFETIARTVGLVGRQVMDCMVNGKLDLAFVRHEFGDGCEDNANLAWALHKWRKMLLPDGRKMLLLKGRSIHDLNDRRIIVIFNLESRPSLVMLCRAK